MNTVFRLLGPVNDMDTYIFKLNVFTDGLYTKGIRAHTHMKLIREWLWEPKGNSLEYIYRLSMNRILYQFSRSACST